MSKAFQVSPGASATGPELAVGQDPLVAFAAALGQQPGQRRAAGKLAQAEDQGILHVLPGFAGHAVDRPGAAMRPTAGAAEMLIRPAQDQGVAQAWQPSAIADP